MTISSNRSGFSLIEMLIVLSILSVILMLAPYIVPEHYQTQFETQLFFSLVAKELDYAQQFAVMSGSEVRIEFSNRVNGMRVNYVHSQMPDKIISLPSRYQIPSRYTFSYFGDGRVNKFNTVYIQDQYAQPIASITFQLGSGKFEIQYD